MTTQDTASSVDTVAASRRRWGAISARAALAALSGAVLYLSFPPRPLWWLAPVSFALLGMVLRGRRARAGFGYGVVAGLGFLLPLLHWTGEYVGLVAWLPLAGAEAVFVGLTGAAIAVVSRTPGAPLWAALLWVAGEAVRARVPFGGFPWGKVAFGQPDGTYVSLAAVGGTPLVGFAVALTGFGLAALGLRLARRDWRPRALAGPVLAVLLPVLAGLAAGPLVGTDANAGTVTAAVVQGNVPRLGLDFNAQRRAVLDNHVRRTEQLAADIRSGKVPRPDLVIWPENSSDIDPYRNLDARTEIDRAAEDVGAPISVGAVVSPADGTLRNTAVLWDPQSGPIDEYVKRKLQPFGETMPMRSFIRVFSPEVDRVTWQFTPGTVATTFAMGPARVGIATCYEVAFDSAVRDSVRAGATLVAIPTNNATFGRTEMTYQQLAMSRVRAVEHGRSVLVAATSGVSAIVTPDGTVTQRTELFTPDALVARVPLRATTTLATRLGAAPEGVMTLLGLAALGWTIAVSARRRRVQRTPVPGGSGEGAAAAPPAGHTDH
jgi:apolipoprotein N-acyltransferase